MRRGGSQPDCEMPMEPDRQGVVLFDSIHTLFELKAALRSSGVPLRAVPTPRHLGSDCGSALVFPMEHIAAVRDTVRLRELDVRGIHELEE